VKSKNQSGNEIIKKRSLKEDRYNNMRILSKKQNSFFAITFNKYVKQNGFTKINKC